MIINKQNNKITAIEQIIQLSRRVFFVRGKNLTLSSDLIKKIHGSVIFKPREKFIK